MAELVDIGVNLVHDSFEGDRIQVLQDARAAGVSRMIVTGTSINDSLAARELAKQHEPLWCTAGIHPHYAQEYGPESNQSLQAQLRFPEVVAAGEMGLDYFRDFSPRPKQQEAFEAQLELAAVAGKPAFLHQRDAHEDFLAIIRPFRSRLPGAVAHCFTGGPDDLADCLDLDLHIGVTGWVCDERRGQQLLNAVPLIPAERLLLETDAPYLLPRTVTPRPKSRRNVPAFLPWVLARVAEARGESPEDVAAQTTANAIALFGLNDKGDG